MERIAWLAGLLFGAVVFIGCGDAGPSVADGGGHTPAPGSTSCTDECTAGATECSGSGLRQCGEFDGVDACLEWSAVEPCAEGFVCDPESVSCREWCGDACDPFSVVVMPDTQYYTNKQPNNASNTYRKQAAWILDHRATERIQTVIHVGDITNNNLPAQWDIADTAHALLDAADMPYSVVTGNHDYLSSGKFDRGASLFDDYFGRDRFKGRTWYGGALGSGNTTNYTFFEVGPMRFMVLSLEYAPRKDTLCEAEKLIAQHPDRRVIVSTHCYLTQDGKYAGNCPDSDYFAVGSNGETVWDELISRHSNIFMVLSGHIGESAYVARNGNAGNTVHQMVVDYQFEAACSATDPSACSNQCQANIYTGNGWLRQLIFDPRANQIRAHTFSVEEGNTSIFPGGKPMLFCSELNGNGNDWYASDPLAEDHAFTFAQQLGPLGPHVREDLGSRSFLDRNVNSAAAGEQLTPRVAMTAGGASVTVWEDDASSADGSGNHDIMARGLAAGGCSAFSDVLVNPDSAGQQITPSVAADAAGHFVVAWADDRDGNGSFQILARGFHPDGTERVPVFTVNAQAAGQQRNPAVAMAPDGRFVVAWEDDPESDGTFQIRMRGFNADGSERFSDRSVHVDVRGQRVAPAVGVDANGGFVVVWQDDSDGNGTFQIHMRGFDAVGTERFSARTANSVADGQQRRPVIGVAASGAFVVAWEDDADRDGTFQILARGFHAEGSQRIADFAVSGAGQHLQPSLSMAEDGAFAFAWQSDPDTNGSFQISARAFRADGAEWAPTWTVNRMAAGQQLAPHVGLAAGTTVVVWQDDMDGNGTHQILARGKDLP